MALTEKWRDKSKYDFLMQFEIQVFDGEGHLFRVLHKELEEAYGNSPGDMARELFEKGKQHGIVVRQESGQTTVARATFCKYLFNQFSVRESIQEPEKRPHDCELMEQADGIREGITLDYALFATIVGANDSVLFSGMRNWNFPFPLIELSDQLYHRPHTVASIRIILRRNPAVCA